MSQTEASASTGSAAPPDFPVVWAKPEYARMFWPQDRMHFPDPLGPLTAGFEMPAFNHGFAAAAADYNLPVTLHCEVHNGYVYNTALPRSDDPATLAELGRNVEQHVAPAIMGLEQIWSERVLPELKADEATLRSFDYGAAADADLAVHLDWVIARRSRHWHLHFIVMVPVLASQGAFAEAYRQVSGSGDEIEPLALLEGLPNRTVDAGHGLWQLGREAAKSPEVRAALELEEPDAVLARLETTPEGQRFAARIHAYLDEFGWRGDSVSMDDRTWVDDPKRPLAMLRGYLDQSDDASPEASRAALAEKREAALARLRDRLADAPPEERGRFEGILRAAQLGNVLHEDHNYYIDQMLQHLSRRAFVEAGRRLAARGQLADAEDALYLTPGELRDALRQSSSPGLRPLVAERRATLAHYRGVRPPPALGTPPPPEAQGGADNPLGAAMGRFFGTPVAQPAVPTEIRGNAGSRGKVTGRALVAMTLAAASGLQPGEVLVCPTTAPPWTPLFATAAAVVTDTGGILSHCAVVAREFRIPAVVGTGVATARIRTGQRVTVDGAAGIVTIEAA